MTVDSSSAVPDPETPVAPDELPPSSTVIRSYLIASIVFLVVGLVLGVVAAAQLLAPDLISGMAPLSYGRLLPVATGVFVYGWLTIGLAGALVHVVASASETRVVNERQASMSLAAMVAGVVVGTVGIALGFSEGRRLLEYPLWADVLLLVGMVGVARVIGQTSRSGAVDAGPVRWYAVAASWWLVLAFVAGNVPGLDGLAGALQTSFFRVSLMGLWLASASVAVVYHVVSRLAGRERFVATRLTSLGFWSLAFVWALTAPASLTYGPVPDWLETVGVVFSIGLIIPPVVIFTDLVLAMRGRWQVAAGDMTLRFVVLGGALLASLPFVSLMQALRASSAVVQFTEWVEVIDVVALYGAFTCWLVAYVYMALPDLMRRRVRPRIMRLHYLGTVLGLIVWIVGGMVGGLSQGWTWVASANEAAVPTVGEGWANTLAAVEWIRPVRLGGFVVFVAAQLLFAAGMLVRHPVERGAAVDIPDVEPDPELILEVPIAPGRLRLGVVGLFLAAAVAVWIVPALETGAAEPTLLADEWRDLEPGSLEAQGRAAYIREGCHYCHTQQVRPIVTDVGLGPVSVDGDYVHESPVLLGSQRIGPDLMHAGSREPTDDAEWVASHLADPRSVRDYSIMPAYDHLTRSELEALAAYIVGLK